MSTNNLLITIEQKCFLKLDDKTSARVQIRVENTLQTVDELYDKSKSRETKWRNHKTNIVSVKSVYKL